MFEKEHVLSKERDKSHIMYMHKGRESGVIRKQRNKDHQKS